MATPINSSHNILNWQGKDYFKLPLGTPFIGGLDVTNANTGDIQSFNNWESVNKYMQDNPNANVWYPVDKMNNIGTIEEVSSFRNPTLLNEVTVYGKKSPKTPYRPLYLIGNTIDPTIKGIFNGSYNGKNFEPTSENISHFLNVYQGDKQVQLTSGDVMEFLNVGTGGLLNRLSPTLNLRLIYDWANNKDVNPLHYGSSWWGNSGIASDEYAQEHPYITFGANFLADLGLGYGINKSIPTINKDVSFSISNPKSSNQYLINGEWNVPKINKDMSLGKTDFIDWIESPAYKLSAEANMKEATSMGLKYVPTYEYPAYLSIKTKGYPIKFTIQPDEAARGWIGTVKGSPITINLAKNGNITEVVSHELAHAARHGWFDPDYPKLNFRNQQSYLRFKNSLVFDDAKADLTQEAGNRFYDFSSEGFPHEAVTNTRDLGKRYGIKVGDPYPGDAETLQLLLKMESEALPGFLKKFILSLKRDPKSLPFVWKALNGTLWMIAPLIIGGYSYEQN